MTLAELRGTRRRREEEGEAHAGGLHATTADYIRVAVALFIITSIEVAIYYIEGLRGVLVELFLALSSIKFLLVVMWYMHLRFDSRLFSFLFAFGLTLAVCLFVAALATMKAGLL